MYGFEEVVGMTLLDVRIREDGHCQMTFASQSGVTHYFVFSTTPIDSCGHRVYEDDGVLKWRAANPIRSSRRRTVREFKSIKEAERSRVGEKSVLSNVHLIRSKWTPPLLTQKITSSAAGGAMTLADGTFVSEVSVEEVVERQQQIPQLTC